ncbi:hypothetical protein [Methylomonas lenta]|nr:hypothetical protein [Methylomonas lenta]
MSDGHTRLIEQGLQRNRPALFLPGVKQKILLDAAAWPVLLCDQELMAY